MLENFKEGQEVSIGVNISSKEFNGKWYNQIDGWKIDAATGEAKTAIEEEGDDLPF